MIVLLPGLDGTGRLFGPFLQCLPANVAVQVISYPDRKMTYWELEDDAVSQLPKDQPVRLIAESFSGPVALQLAGRADLDIAAAVLICSFGAYPIGVAGRVLAKLPIERLPSIPSFVIRHLLLSPDDPADLQREVADCVRSVDSAVLAHRLKQVLASDYCTRPVEARCRVLALSSRKDRLLRRLAQRSIRKACPTAELVPITAPHLALQSVPEHVLRTLFDLGILGTYGRLRPQECIG